MGMDEYSSLGMIRAIESLGVPSRRLRDVDVRMWINEFVPPDKLMYATVADFWLELKKWEGQRRRKQQPPASPFRNFGKGGRAADQAYRREIEEWHTAWCERLGAETVYKAVEGRTDSVSVLMAEELRRKHAWLMLAGTGRGKQRAVVGFANNLPAGLLEQAYADPEAIYIEHLTLADALRRSWFDRDERGLWIRVLGWMHDTALSELRANYASEMSEIQRLALTDLASREVLTEPSQREPIF